MKTSRDTDVKDSAKKLQQLVKKMEIVIMSKSVLDQYTFPDQAEIEIEIDQGSIS